MITLRPPRQDELPAASDLCYRSKATWGYDAEFMQACVEELSLRAEDIDAGGVVLAVGGKNLAGVAQISGGADACCLEKLFVDPDYMRKGVGRTLFAWCCREAAGRGASHMIVDADPGAVPFYLKMGCRHAGTAPSGSIPGRVLPRLIVDVSTAGTR